MIVFMPVIVIKSHLDVTALCELDVEDDLLILPDSQSSLVGLGGSRLHLRGGGERLDHRPRIVFGVARVVRRQVCYGHDRELAAHLITFVFKKHRH